MTEKIIDKLRKLIAHEKSARAIGSLDEAAKFAAKIQQLLDDYNLSMSDVEVEEARSTVDGEARQMNVSNLWQKIFLRDLAEIHGCAAIFGRAPVVVIAGNQMDRLIVIELFEYFESLGRDLAAYELREWQRTVDYRRKRKKTMYSRRFTTSFCYGFMSALLRRMKDQRDADLAAANTNTGLIYIGNKLADSNAWVSNNLKIRTTQQSPDKKKIRDDAYVLGLLAGNRVALTTKTIG